MAYNGPAIKRAVPPAGGEEPGCSGGVVIRRKHWSVPIAIGTANNLTVVRQV